MQCPNANSCNVFNVGFEGSVVPVPAALPLLASGLIGLRGLRCAQAQRREAVDAAACRVRDSLEHAAGPGPLKAAG